MWVNLLDKDGFIQFKLNHFYCDWSSGVQCFIKSPLWNKEICIYRNAQCCFPFSFPSSAFLLCTLPSSKFLAMNQLSSAFFHISFLAHLWKQWSRGHLFPPGAAMSSHCFPVDGGQRILNSPTLCHPSFPAAQWVVVTTGLTVCVSGSLMGLSNIWSLLKLNYYKMCQISGNKSSIYDRKQKPIFKMWRKFKVYFQFYLHSLWFTQLKSN